MPDLSTTYLGLNLKNPLVVSPSPLCEEIGNLIQMEDAGAAAVVLHSLFEEQILIESQALDQGLSLGVESFAESLSYFPDMTAYNLGPEGYLEHIRKAKQAVNIPVIASLNGVTTGGWIKYARLMQEAGADALELNIFYLANDPELSGADVEELYTSLVSHVKASVRIPVAVKLGPYFSSMAHMAKKLDEAGADALVLFNRFYQPDFDLENLEVVPALHLSTPHELLLRLHWVATLYGHVRADLAVTGGVHTAHDVLKAMMAGARVAMMTSALLRHGIDHIRTVLRDLVQWMEEHEYESVRQMQGSMSRRNVPDPSAFSRANYMKVLSSYAVKTPVR
ncbi:MAG: dihydroorotate dehydrogenase-like protein [Bryobacteraceae bacterium]|jgi:dihydroorotate dehydrogenase (fumarate)|nr:dihydroorotate dehydrogenase-like protein [Bryobacteraceae bacterium]